RQLPDGGRLPLFGLRRLSGGGQRKLLLFRPRGPHPSGDLRIVAWPVQHATLVVSGAPDGAVREPAAWALMIMGFGGVGAGLRRRRAPCTVA
ncbi:MAG: PEPxxWA-CTERM sorting domain-containing protein, partial [Proteobacteria bacterium]|nr:PEPxxWA-CTERM sorting domain-containing protein [Pseudomonadota bacterium]